jgi:hypothetical protein
MRDHWPASGFNPNMPVPPFHSNGISFRRPLSISIADEVMAYLVAEGGASETAAGWPLQNGTLQLPIFRGYSA